MENNYSIRVYKQYFNFASSHFLVFSDGDREPLHGHNYRVQIIGKAPALKHDMVFDFLDIKPIVREVCDELDHRLLLPKENPFLRYSVEGPQVKIELKNEYFSIPKADIIFLPISNTSAERLAIYIHGEVSKRVLDRYKFSFERLEIEVEETPGQSAIYCAQDSL